MGTWILRAGLTDGAVFGDDLMELVTVGQRKGIGIATGVAPMAVRKRVPMREGARTLRPFISSRLCT